MAQQQTESSEHRLGQGVQRDISYSPISRSLPSISGLPSLSSLAVPLPLHIQLQMAQMARLHHNISRGMTLSSVRNDLDHGYDHGDVDIEISARSNSPSLSTRSISLSSQMPSTLHTAPVSVSLSSFPTGSTISFSNALPLAPLPHDAHQDTSSEDSVVGEEYDDESSTSSSSSDEHSEIQHDDGHVMSSNDDEETIDAPPIIIRPHINSQLPLHVLQPTPQSPIHSQSQQQQ